MYRTRKEGRTIFGLNIFSAAFIAAILVSLALNIYLIKQNNTKKHYILELENKYSELENQYSGLENQYFQLGIDEYEATISNMNNTIMILNQNLTKFKIENSELEKDILSLKEKIKLFLIMVEGTAKTRSPLTKAVSITFDNGIKHTVPVINNTYTIILQNNQTYEVSIQWKTTEIQPCPGSRIAGTLALFHKEITKEENWEIP